MWVSPVLLRDILGRSMGKIFIGLEIKNIESGGKPSLLQRVVRNVTFPLTTFEGIFLFLPMMFVVGATSLQKLW